MITVKIFHDDEQVEELQIMIVGGGLQGLGGPTGEYNYMLMKPRQGDMPPIPHNPTDGDLVLVAKTLLTLIDIYAKEPIDNIIQFPTKEKADDEN